jgi:hypothetical protein
MAGVRVYAQDVRYAAENPLGTSGRGLESHPGCGRGSGAIVVVSMVPTTELRSLADQTHPSERRTPEPFDKANSVVCSAEMVTHILLVGAVRLIGAAWARLCERGLSGL